MCIQTKKKTNKCRFISLFFKIQKKSSVLKQPKPLPLNLEEGKGGHDSCNYQCSTSAWMQREDNFSANDILIEATF